MRNATITFERTSGDCASPIGYFTFFEPILFHLVEQVCLAATQVDNLWTPISVLLLHSALLTVIRITDARAPTDDTPALIRAIVALVANPDESARPHIGVADHTLSVTLFTQPPNGNSSLLSAEYQVRMMLCHFPQLSLL